MTSVRGAPEANRRWAPRRRAGHMALCVGTWRATRRPQRPRRSRLSNACSMACRWSRPQLEWCSSPTNCSETRSSQQCVRSNRKIEIWRRISCLHRITYRCAVARCSSSRFRLNMARQPFDGECPQSSMRTAAACRHVLSPQATLPACAEWKYCATPLSLSGWVSGRSVLSSCVAVDAELSPELRERGRRLA